MRFFVNHCTRHPTNTRSASTTVRIGFVRGRCLGYGQSGNSYIDAGNGRGWGQGLSDSTDTEREGPVDSPGDGPLEHSGGFGPPRPGPQVL